MRERQLILVCVWCFRFVNLLLNQMSIEELREEACDCLFEIINKGMDPVDKTKLVESLSQVLQTAGFFNVEQVNIWRGELELHESRFRPVIVSIYTQNPHVHIYFFLLRRKTWTSWPSFHGW